MAQYDERALVLGVAAYRETSSLIRLLTEHEGRLSLIARGLRSPRQMAATAALQTFNVVRVRFTLKDGATLGNLISAELEQAAQAPHQSVEAYALATYWFEILNETSQERTTMAGAFDLTMVMLRDQHTSPGLTLQYIRALLDLCRETGFAMEWNRCVACGAARRSAGTPLNHFSISRGGTVCAACAADGAIPALALTPAETNAAAALAPEPPLANPPAQKHLFALLEVINRYLVNHLEHPLRTFRFVSDMMKR